MIEPTPLEKMVSEGLKPGAHGSAGDDLSQSEELYESLGIEAVNYEAHHLKIRAIGSLALVSDIWNDFETTPRLNNYAPYTNQILEELGNRSIAQAIAFLDLYPRPRAGNPSNLELPQVAILDGALFGYHPECVDYYIATRYEGEPEDPRAKDSWRFLDVFAPDQHVPAPSCPRISEIK